jgi:hypothetical protein
MAEGGLCRIGNVSERERLLTVLEGGELHDDDFEILEETIW